MDANTKSRGLLQGKFIFKKLPNGDIDKTKVVCTLCNAELVYCRSSSSLKYHLNAKHPYADDAGPSTDVPHGKRARQTTMSDFNRSKRGPFIHISGEKGVYISERWEPNGSTLYLPVSGSLLTNIEKYDQISFEQGLFFIGDVSGAFQEKAQGQAIHCWRYNEQEKKLFIALSYFFTNLEAFQDVVNDLGCL